MDKLLVLEALTKIGVEGPRSAHVGICGNLSGILLDDYEVDFNSAQMTARRIEHLLYPYFNRWPETSGDTGRYPVEGTPGAYGLHFGDRWDMKTEYGRKRYRLLAWLIHEITKEVRNECT